MVIAVLKTVRTDVYTKFFNHLQTGTYAISTNNIHPHLNRLQTIQEDYPQIIVNPPEVAFEKLTFGLGGSTLYSANFALTIDVYHNSSENAKSMADEITHQIIIGQAVFRNDNIKRIETEADDLDVQDINARTSVHKYMITVTGVVIGKVTS